MPTLDHDRVERLAEAMHEHYLAERNRAGVAMGATAAMASWRQLDDDLREANRDQARDIVAKLARIGAMLIPAGHHDPTAGLGPEFAFTEAELELLARREQTRWRRQRTSAGWVYGDERDDRARRHPSLVSWSRLSESERDKDREAVRNLPAVVAAAGLRIVRG